MRYVYWDVINIFYYHTFIILTLFMYPHIVCEVKLSHYILHYLWDNVINFPNYINITPQKNDQTCSINYYLNIRISQLIQKISKASPKFDLRLRPISDRLCLMGSILLIYFLLRKTYPIIEEAFLSYDLCYYREKNF